jgi:hypothetical protein
LDQVLKNLSVPLALSLTATFLSGNNLNLFNNWFNGSFNRIQPMLQGETDLTGQGEPEVLSPSVSIQVEPSVVLPERDVATWRQFATGSDRPLDLSPSDPLPPDQSPDFNIPGASEVPAPSGLGPQSLHQVVPPIQVDQWFATRSSYPSLSLVVFEPDGWPTGATGGWGRDRDGVGSLLTARREAGLDAVETLTGAIAPGEYLGSGVSSGAACPTVLGFDETGAMAVPEPGMVVALGIAGMVVIGSTWI